jgi:hypothetical protein
MKDKGMKKFRYSTDLKRVFEELLFKSVKSFDLRLNIDEIHNNKLPNVLEFIF